MICLKTSIYFLLLASATTLPVQANANEISSSSSSLRRGSTHHLKKASTRQRPRSMVEEDNIYVPCQSAADCAGPVYMLTESPINEVAEELDQQRQEQNEQSDTSPSTEANEYGFSYKPEAVTGGDGMEVLCVPHSSNNGSFVCTIRTIITMQTGDSNVNASQNRECRYSPTMQRTLCIITEAMGGVTESGPETKPATSTALVVPATPLINEEEEDVPETDHDIPPGTAFGTFVGDCPTPKPQNGDSCVEYVQVGTPQRSCTYNNIQCNCALQEGISIQMGWSCRDVGLPSF